METKGSLPQSQVPTTCPYHSVTNEFQCTLLPYTVHEPKANCLSSEQKHMYLHSAKYSFLVLPSLTCTGCNRRNGPDLERVFLRSNYTDIIQNTYIQSWTVTEILAREKSGLLWCLRTVLVGDVILPLLELNSYVIVRSSASDLDNGPASKSV